MSSSIGAYPKAPVVFERWPLELTQINNGSAYEAMTSLSADRLA